MAKKKKTQEQVCNICGCPRRFYYEQLNPETGKIEGEWITVACGGHPYIRPHLWNKTPEYQAHQRRLLQNKIQRERAEKRKGDNHVSSK